MVRWLEMAAHRLMLALIACILAGSGFAFANVAVGDKLENRTLAKLDGGKQPYLGKASVNVFVFVTPGQPYSQAALKDLAPVQKELAAKSVAWVLIASDRYPKEAVKADVSAAAFDAPVLIDPEDALYGTLGTHLTPVIGIADGQHKLVAYLPFTKVNYPDSVRAWILRALGELSAEQLAAVLEPPKLEQGASTTAGAARRYVKMGERQLQSGSLDKAAENARKAIAADPEAAAAHGLLAAALARQGQCAQAAPEIDLALAKDAAEPLALAARTSCAGGAPAPAAPAADAGSPDAGR